MPQSIKLPEFYNLFNFENMAPKKDKIKSKSDGMPSATVIKKPKEQFTCFSTIK